MKRRFIINSLNVLLWFVVIIACTEKERLPDPIAAGWKGEKVCEIIFEDEHLRVLKCTFAPGIGHDKHYHEPHFGYTLSGSLFEITDASGVREVNVPTGGNFNNNEITWHQVLNIGDSTASFLIFAPE